MDYQNLDHEIKEYLAYFKYCDSINLKFSSFFKEFVQSGTKFILKSKKSIDEFCSEINRIEYFPTTLNKNLNNYCDEFKEILNKTQNIFTNVEKDIIIKINEFDRGYKNDYKNFINQLNNLNNYLAENKIKLEKIKNNYFDSCKQVQEFNKKYISGISKEENPKHSEPYEKLKQASESKKVDYRIEVTKFNDLLLKNETYYLDIINSISKKEEDRSQYYANILLLLNNNIKQFNFESKELLLKNEKFIDNIFTKRDIKLFNLYFNKTNNNKDNNRFICEEFFDFENINESNSNNEIKENENNNNIIKKNKINKENEASEIMKIDYILAEKMNQIGKEPMMQFDIMDNEYIELDNIILDLIQKKEKIDNEKFLQIINLIEVKSDGCKKFIYILMNHYLQKNIVKFNCVENIFLLNSILNIIINYIWENDEYTYLAFIIIYIGERTIYNDPKDKDKRNYLCKIMAKNSIYHINDFWSKIINLKIKMLARIRLTEELFKRKKNSTKKETGLMYKFFGVTNDEYDKIENDILYSQLYKENAPIYLAEILEEHINHFICYEFSEKKTIDLIEQFSEKYCLNKKQKNYFIKVIESNIIYMKAPNPYFLLIKSSKKIAKRKFKKINNKTIQILLFAMNYLSKDDIISIFTLNKECYSILKKYYYKNIIIKNNSKIDIKKHVSIWRILLGYQDLKKKYNYKELKETIITKDSNNIKNNNSIVNDKKENEFDTIELDCIRTSFRLNQEENQKKLCNILKVATKQIPSIYYCQGMNHIASFLLVLCEENEEEAFYLYLCILLGTDYCNIIDDDLTKLNSFFYCFERVLNLMFPEMYNFLNNNNINGGYYLSPWFITLFTLAYDYQKENNNKEIIVKIFDLFLFTGWKAIFKIGISLIKINFLKIFSLPYEKLVHFLNNDIIHSNFFINENANEIMNVFINFKISNNLINNLSEEYKIKKNIINKNN